MTQVSLAVSAVGEAQCAYRDGWKPYASVDSFLLGFFFDLPGGKACRVIAEYGRRAGLV
jgi:hypothetical protein